MLVIDCAIMMMKTAHPGRDVDAALTGLALAWGGTALMASPVMSAFGDPARTGLLALGAVLYWALAAAVIAIALFWEKQPLQSVWLKPFQWQSVLWGLLLVGLNYAVFLPAGEWVRRSAGLAGFSAGMEEIMKFPLWYRVLAVIGAGILEELLFRGYTVTRLITLTGRVWLAALLAWAGFGLLHMPMWGPGFVVSGLIGGAGAMAFFVWRKDLLAMMVFHTITDGIGIVVAPMFSEWWNNASWR